MNDNWHSGVIFPFAIGCIISRADVDTLCCRVTQCVLPWRRATNQYPFSRSDIFDDAGKLANCVKVWSSSSISRLDYYKYLISSNFLPN